MRRAALLLFAAALGCSGEIALPTNTTPTTKVTPPIDCSASPLPPRRVRRLTAKELDAAVSAALQQSASLSGKLSPDVVVEGFDTMSDSLLVTPLFAAQLSDAAHAIALTVAANPQLLAPCNDTSASCRDQVISTFGARAFRRALTAVEAEEYANLYALAAGDGHGAAAGLVVEAMLQSPYFLYRTELGTLGPDGTWTLTPNELAQSLSFLVTGAPPDDALVATAATLTDPSAVQAQVSRLLATPAGTNQLGNFAEEWLGLDPLSFVAKSGDTGAAFTDAVRASMREEARQFHAAAFKTGTYRTLVDPGFGVVDATLASFYGLPGENFVQTPWPNSERGGVLTLGAFLAVYGKADASAPVQRGKAVRGRLLCEDLPPPPPNVNAQPPTPTPGTSARQRYAAHESDASCSGCHRRIDLIGFGLEHYDGAGRFRETEAGVAIDDSGLVLGLDGVDTSFSGVRGLATALAKSPQARGCYGRQWVRFGLGSNATSDGFACVSKALEAQLAAADAPLSNVLVALAQADGFRHRAGPSVAPTPLNDGPVTFAPASPSDGGTGTTTTQNGVDVAQSTNSDWATGFCEDVTVSNPGSASVDWQVTLTVNGTVTQSWNSSFTATAQGVSFTGAAWNMTLAPGASASFGYCANK